MKRRRKDRRVYVDSRWIELRDKVRKRAGCTLGTCVGRCERCGITHRPSIHHKHPVEDGGDPFPGIDGLEPLCPTCHKREHRVEGPDPSGTAWARLVAGQLRGD